MNPYSNKCLLVLLVSLLVNSYSFAKEFNEESLLKAMESVSWIDPLRNPSADGSMISWLSENPSPVPLFYPKLVPLFDFMDMGNVLSALLTTEEGDNVCTAIVKLNNTIQKQMETQNKILLKILTALNKKEV